MHTRSGASLRRRVALWSLLGGALGLWGCPRPSGPGRIAYFERHATLPALPSVTYNYYPLKVAAAKGRVAVIDGAPALGFKNSRVLLFDAASGALLSLTDIPRGTQRNAKAAAISADPEGRFYVAIEGRGETHLLRLTPPPPAAPEKKAPAAPTEPPAPEKAGPVPSADRAAPARGAPHAEPRKSAVLGLLGPGNPRLTAALKNLGGERGKPLRGGVVGGVAGGGIGIGVLGGAALRGPRPAEEWDALRGASYPTGLHAGAGETLWLVDAGNQRIIKLSWKGSDPVVFGSPRELDTPRGLAVTADGGFFTKLARGPRSRILRYDARGTLRGGFDVDGLEDSLAWFHNDLRLGRDGKLYVTDYARSRVLVFSAAGAPAGELRDDSFKGPMGLAFDEQDNLFVADAFGKQVLRFRPVYEKEAAARAAAAAKKRATPSAGQGPPAAAPPAEK